MIERYYAGLLERLEESPNHAFILAAYERRELITALRTLLESNKELERERDQLLDKLHCMCGSPIDHSAWEGHTPVSVYDYSLDQERSRAEAAEARVTELEDICNSLEAQAMGLAYDLKRAEARLAEAMKVIGQIDTALNDQFAAGIEEREGGSARRQERLMKSGEELRRAARDFMKENGNGE